MYGTDFVIYTAVKQMTMAHDKEKIGQDLYEKSLYCHATNYEVDLVIEYIDFWGYTYDEAIKRVARMMLQY